MKLVEVVIANQTSEETRDRALAFVRQVNKLPVVVRDRPGFLINRVLFPYLLDAVELFEGGIGRQEIDQALVDWGMPMGPLRLIDEIGVDIAIDIAETLEKAFGRRDHAPAVLQWLRENKMLGRKTGGGLASRLPFPRSTTQREKSSVHPQLHATSPPREGLKISCGSRKKWKQLDGWPGSLTPAQEEATRQDSRGQRPRLQRGTTSCSASSC